MKTLVMMLVFLVSYYIADGQTGNNPEAVIERMINSGSLEGHDQKVIGPMGDAAAVVLTKVLAGRRLSAGEIDSSLLILNMAFADPSMVEIASDRKPRAALFILQAFDYSVQDAALKKRIAETRKYIQEQSLKWSHSPKVVRRFWWDTGLSEAVRLRPENCLRSACRQNHGPKDPVANLDGPRR